MLDIKKEIEFWSLIMRDHALFQNTSLSLKEKDAIKTVQYFINQFSSFHQEVKIGDSLSDDFIKKVKSVLKHFIQFKKLILIKLMKCDIEIAMTPTFLNHMINEALEYLYVLNLTDESIPHNRTLENIRLHKVWLADASGHAKHIISQLDGIEFIYIDESEKFMKKFDKLFKKAYELYQLFDRSEQDTLYQFNIEVERILMKFIDFLENIEKLRQDCHILANGTFNSLVPNHMIREERYYLYRIKLLKKF